MVSELQTVRDTVRDEWNLMGRLAKNTIYWRVNRVKPANRFSAGLDASFEFYTMTAPHKKTSPGKATYRRVVVLDIWKREPDMTEETIELYEDEIRQMIAEVCRIIRAQQRSMTGIKLAYVMNREVNLDELENQILRRQMTIALLEEEA